MKNIIPLIGYIILVSAHASAQIWTNETKLIASDRTDDVGFGNSVARIGQIAVVGAPYEDFDDDGQNEAPGAGAAYVYEQNDRGVWTQVQKLVARDRSSGDVFGRTCAIFGDYIVVGAEEEKHDIDGGNEIKLAGSVYVYKRNNSGIWEQHQKLVAWDRKFDGRFGSSVALNGSYLVVGAWSERYDENGENQIPGCGAAYVFKLNGQGQWEKDVKLMPTVRWYFENFGCDVAIENDLIVIGARRDGLSKSKSDLGAVYVFQRNLDDEWESIQKILPEVRSEQKFGWSVDISNKVIIVGAPEHWAGASNVYSNTGLAYIFEYDNTLKEWKQKVVFQAGEIKREAYFGYDVAIYNSYAVIGARGEDNASGSVYVVHRQKNGEWTGLERIKTSDAYGGDYFGGSVDIWNGKIIGGAHGEDHNLEGKDSFYYAGSAYLFDANKTLNTHNSLAPFKFKVAPNPAHDHIQIQFDQIVPNYTIEIIDQLGRTVQQEQGANKQSIQVAIRTNPGLYQMMITIDGVQYVQPIITQ